MKPPKLLPSQEDLLSLLQYDPADGRLYWRQRPREMFSEERLWKMWNARCAGKEAFTTTNADGYRTGAVRGVACKAHRVVFKMHHGSLPEKIDHINGNPGDNRIENLRGCTDRSNAKNQRLRKTNTSGVMGVTWCKRDKRFVARIGTKHLGNFVSFEDAVQARKRAEEALGYHQNHGRPGFDGRK